MITIIALWVLVLIETVLLVLLLRALGEMRQNGHSVTKTAQSPESWGLTVGEKAPAFTGTDQDGNIVNFENFQGKRRVIAFVLPGCSACSDIIAAMNALLDEEKGIVMLAIGASDVESNRAYAIEHHAQMPILATMSHIEDELYHVQGVPFVFIVDEVGIIQAKGVVNDGKRLHDLVKVAF